MLAAIFSRRTLSCVVSRLPAALPRAATAAIARPLLTAPLALRPPSLAARLLHAAPVARTPLEEFIDPYEQDPDLPAPGRRWEAKEMRLKSNEDLQKLWVVLMRERNMLHSTRMLHEKRKTQMPHKSRLAKVRKSMAMVKVVLGERRRELDAARKAARAEGRAKEEAERLEV